VYRGCVPDPAALETFRARFRGTLIAPGDPEYDAARLVDNGAIDRRPLLIARADGPDDVAAAIHLARSSGLRLAVRGGGHSVAGHSTGDGVIVLDLSGMQGVEIDVDSRTAWAEAGVLAGQYTKAAFARGFATPFGDNGGVGIAGITLGGGIGWLARKHGLTIDSLLAVELVTADGDRILASSDSHPELFWALRGGGGNFGVATRFKFRLHPIGTTLAGTILLPLDPAIARELLTIALAAPDELTMMPMIMPAPDADEIPANQRGRLALWASLVWAGPREAGEQAIAAIRALATPLFDDVDDVPYPSLYPEPSGRRDAWTARAVFLDRVDDDVMATVGRWMSAAPSPTALAQFRILGGETGRVAPEATAFAWRDRPVMLWIIADFGDADAADWPRHESWAAAFADELRGTDTATYVNFMGDEGPDAVASAYSPATWARLREVKRRYDPDNLFRHNQNIPPA